MPIIRGIDASASPNGRNGQLTTNRAGLIGEMLFGRNITTSRFNSAGLKVAGAEVLTGNPSAPVYGDHQVDLGNGAGIDTGIVSPSGAQTTLIVCQAAQVDVANMSPTIFGGSSAAVNGRLLILVSGTYNNGAAYIPDITPTAADFKSPLHRPLTDFRCFAASLSGSAQGATLTMGEYFGGALLQQATAQLAAGRSAPGSNLITGNSSNLGPGQFTGRPLYTARLDWNRELSAAEKLAAYLEVRAFLAPYKAI